MGLHAIFDRDPLEWTLPCNLPGYCNEKPASSVGREEPFPTFRGSKALSGPINQKLSASAISFSYLSKSVIETELTPREPCWIYDGRGCRIAKGLVSNMCLFELLATLKVPVAELELLVFILHLAMKGESRAGSV